MQIGAKYEYFGNVYELIDDNKKHKYVYLQSVNNDAFVQCTRARFLALVASGRTVEKSENE